MRESQIHTKDIHILLVSYYVTFEFTAYALQYCLRSLTSEPMSRECSAILIGMCQSNVKIRQFVTIMPTKTQPRSLNTEILGIFPKLLSNHHAKPRPFSNHLIQLGNSSILFNRRLCFAKQRQKPRWPNHPLQS